MQPSNKDPSDHARAESEAPSGAAKPVAHNSRAMSQPPTRVKDGVKAKPRSNSFTEDRKDEDTFKVPTGAKSEAPTALGVAPSNLITPSNNEGSVAIPVSDAPAASLSGSPNLISSAIKDCSGPAMIPLAQSPSLDAPSTKEDLASPAAFITTTTTPATLTEHGDTSFGEEKIEAQKSNTDAHMSEVAASDSQPHIPTAEADVSIPGARAVTPDAEVSISTTPPGSPAPSIPDFPKYFPHIHTSSGEAATESAIGFPNCAGGDVLIVSSTGRTWKLHATTLRNSSSVLRGMIDSTEAFRPSKRQRNIAQLVRWKIMMVPLEEKPEDTRLRSFKAVGIRAKTPSLIGVNTDGVCNSIAPCDKVYDNLFRILYNYEPYLTPPRGDDVNNHVLDIIYILKAAEHLGAGPAVRDIVESSFLRLDQLLYNEIALKPATWADIAVRLQSAVVFRVAMAHVIGRFDLQGQDGIKKVFMKKLRLPNGESLMEFAARKNTELRKEKARVERMMLQYYPPPMLHPKTADDEPPPNREIYANDIYLWQAVTLVRQYFASAMLSNINHRSSDGGAYFYQCIGAGDEYYLGRGVLEGFHDSFAMSAEGKERLHAAVQSVKEGLREVVRPLLVDRSLIHRGAEDPMPPYLTCCEIADEELPWLVEKMQSEDENEA